VIIGGERERKRAGKLVVFEGAEGVGKTTQARRLIQWLSDHHVPHLALREPGGTPLGEGIRQLLLDPANTLVPEAEALLFVASRAQLVAERIIPALEAGHIVVLDRFFLSTYAYQIYGRGLDATYVLASNRMAVGDLVPDITLVLDLPLDEGFARTDARGARDRIESSGDEFHRRVSTAFAEFTTEKWQQTHPECGPIERIDARGDEETIFVRICGVLARYCPEPFAALPSSI
jgi:dTMP kinase